MISVVSAVRVSLRALLVNKMRSALTMLGIVIGVAAVIAMVALGTGATRMVENSIAAMGTNLLMVHPGSVTSGGSHMGMGSQSTLTLEDANAIRDECPAVEEVAPMVMEGAQLVFGNQNWNTQVTGTTAGILTVRDLGLSAGRPFTDQDVRSAGKVALLGQTVVDNLFGGQEPVGQVVRIKKIPFRVVGVLERKGQSAMGQDQDDQVYVPITTAQKRLVRHTTPGSVRMVFVKARSADLLPAAEQQMRDLLLQRHRIGPRQDADFDIRNISSAMEAMTNATNVMTLLLAAIASVSLLVGGIGIMNIMLVSVTERTREIGIRMAVGARGWDIRSQFLIEAVTLSLLGGLVGIGIGSGGAAIVAHTTGWPVTVSPFSVALAFAFSALVGISFGFYPAWKASRLNPIDALRYE